MTAWRRSIRRKRFSARAAAWAGLVLLTAARAAPGGDEPSSFERLHEARGLFLEGYYDRAAEVYAALAEVAATRIEAHVGLTDVDEQRGKYREAIARLRGVAGEGEASDLWHRALGTMLVLVGEYDEAITHERRALEISEENCRARYELGRLLETLGRRREAIEVYEWFDRLLRERLPDLAEDLTYAGRGFYRYSVLTRHENLKERCKYVLQEVFQEAFDFVDARYWPARLAAAELLLEKHNTEEASEDFRQILKASAAAAPAHVGLANVALERWAFDDAEKYATAALEINPRSAAARLALGRTRMLERRYERAAEEAEAILAVNPRSVEGLALLAAARLRGGRVDEAEAAKRRLAAIAPNSALLHHELGVWLSAARQYDEAEREFKRAIEYDPTWSEPRTELGLMYMQSGDERAARVTLEASWALDSFNHETFNVLGLLDELEKFARHESERFVVKYDAAQDAVIVPYFQRVLHEVYDDVTAEFETPLARPTIIEVFPQHSRFSVRITGRPWIHTVGACTGAVIALDAPRKTAAMSLFNWARVLRHEFTHTVTLAATENRIPHWMTEGMAVYAEHAPRPWDWTLLLAEAIREDRLFTLKTIDWGFMRPRRRTDRTLAYAQSEWMVEYIVERWGFPALLSFLQEFRERRTQEQAFRSVLGVSTQRFGRDFAAWARRQAESWGLPLEPPPDRKKLRALLLLNPNDAAARARLAEAAMQDQSWGDALKLAQETLELKPDEVRALRVLVTLLADSAESVRDRDARRRAFEEAAGPIEKLARLAPDDPDAAMALARLEQARENWTAALAALEKYRRLRPGDPDSLRRMAGTHLILGQSEKALPLLEQLFPLAEDEPAVAKEVSRLYEAASNLKAAALWLERAIEVDPYDADTHRQLGAIYSKLGRADREEIEYRSLCILEPDRPEGYENLAALLRRLGRAEEAAEQERLAAARRNAPGGGVGGEGQPGRQPGE